MKVEKVILAKDRECGEAADRIHVAMSPAELDKARWVFRKMALNTASYSNQTEYREFKEFFDEAYEKWEEADNRSRQEELEKDKPRPKE